MPAKAGIHDFLTRYGQIAASYLTLCYKISEIQFLHSPKTPPSQPRSNNTQNPKNYKNLDLSKNHAAISLLNPMDIPKTGFIQY
jgi:hypothetical protein